MARVLIIYHSQSGNTEMLARSVVQGVVETEGAHAVFKRAVDADAHDIRDCDAMVICSPEYFGYMAGAVKDLFDRTYEELRDDAAIYKKPYCIVISAGNDGSGALAHIERICKGYRFRKVQHPIICKGQITEETLTQCFELGRTIAEGVNAGIF
ncbi:MAG: NAD(P)H dehydrogenase (quinone) [Syntrophorhabdus sp. PtaU1.Bin058]|nr:MAG: NAD(P)H dehydrogenase (quinone) [Syntrophorhabdus sp. PtaU1.Bin058]